jgi:hypothetical protein
MLRATRRAMPFIVVAAILATIAAVLFLGMTIDSD